MKMIVPVVPAIARPLMHHHHVRERYIEQPVECGEVLLLRLLEIGDRLEMTFWCDVRLVRIACKERNVRCKAPILRDDPLVEVQFLLKDVAEQTPFIFLKVLFAATQFFLCYGRNE